MSTTTAPATSATHEHVEYVDHASWCKQRNCWGWNKALMLDQDTFSFGMDWDKTGENWRPIPWVVSPLERDAFIARVLEQLAASGREVRAVTVPNGHGRRRYLRTCEVTVIRRAFGRMRQQVREVVDSLN
jgi:hypothetical protein